MKFIVMISIAFKALLSKCEHFHHSNLIMMTDIVELCRRFTNNGYFYVRLVQYQSIEMYYIRMRRNIFQGIVYGKWLFEMDFLWRKLNRFNKLFLYRFNIVGQRKCQTIWHKNQNPSFCLHFPLT